jgi:hypothetical protein
MQFNTLSRRIVAVPMPAPPREIPTSTAKQPEPVGKT